MNKDKPWLKFYESHVPEHIDYPKETLPEALKKTVGKYPDFPALIFKGTTVTYAEYYKAVKRFASALQNMGVKKGDRVAIHLPNCPQFPIAYNAVLLIGGITVPCNPVYTGREMKHQLKDSGVEVIITLSSMYPMIKKIRGETQLRHVIVAKVKTYFPPFLKLLFTLLKEKKGGHKVDISKDENTSWFADVLASGSDEPDPVKVTWDDTAVLMYTGGTTGVSKGAELTHKNVYTNAYMVNVWINSKEAVDSSLVSIPLYHSYAMTCCMNPASIAAMTQILVPDPRNLVDVLETIHKSKPSFYPGVPAMYVAINNHPKVEKYDLRSLKFCNSGAAPLPIEVQERFQEITGSKLVEGYGLSEASPVTHSNPAYGENRVGTIGVPWPDTEVKIVAEDGKTILGVDEVGELCIRGPQIMKGYWFKPDETAIALRPDPDGGDPWLYTGDMVQMSKDGYFEIVDRKKDMILGVGGFNIYPSEIEDVLFEHPKILEACAAGVQIPDKGERVKAFVVLKPGETATSEEIIDFCKENLAPYKIPKFVEFRQELPKTLVGKILRRELIRQHNEELAEVYID